MIKQFIEEKIFKSQPANSVASAALIITLAGLMSRILGLLRDRLLATSFGAGDVMDAYYAAFRIPDLIYNLIILGALSAAFIPVFTSLITQKKETEAWKLMDGIMNLAVVFIVVFSIIFGIGAPIFMKIITPGFDASKLSLSVSFMRVMLLSPLFLGISGIFGASLVSFKRFLVYSIAPVMYNLGIIFGIIVLVPIMGPIGLAWGVVLGAFSHMALQYPANRHLGFHFRWMGIAPWRDANVRKVTMLMVPRVMGIAVNQVSLLITTVFASTLAAGSLAVFNFSQNLQSVALGLFGISFAIAAFPVLSAYWAKEEKEKFVKSFSDTFQQILFFVIPISVGMLVLRSEIVRVVLGAGKFDWNDTIRTYECLGFFVISLFAQSTIPLLARAFYAIHDTKTPFFIAILSEAINLSLIIFFIKKFEVVGLVMAFSLANIFQMLILMIFLHQRFGKLRDGEIILSTLKISGAAFLSGLVIQISKNLVGNAVDMDTFFGVFLKLVISGTLGILVFFAFSAIFNVREFFQLKTACLKKIFGVRQVIEEDTRDVSGI